MTVVAAIADAERLLPGTAAPDGEPDFRWQAMVAVGDFVQSEPDAVWRFASKWGASEDEDLRAAIATCVLEHLLEYHFDALIGQVEDLARRNRFFADTVRRCWAFGLASESPRAARLRAAGRGLRQTPS
jgi:hypothetical protein